MIQHFIVAKTFTHQIDCFCPGKEHVNFFTFEKDDVVEVTNECKFINEIEWYSLIIINNRAHFYIAIVDLEQYCRKEQIISILDIELKINYLRFLINQALDTVNKESFLNYTTELNELIHIQKKYLSPQIC